VRKLLAGLTVAVFVLALGTVAFAATQTLSGQLIDQMCYKLNKSNTGVIIRCRVETRRTAQQPAPRWVSPWRY
jgi:hypothetical protein